ncbi:MAG: peptidylprolyl isomerase [Methanothrix sp.]|nr:peptidylprolyl isomerase [Methanothrix sp.]
MNQAKIGDTVRVHYSGQLDNGFLFDSSEGSEPLELELGSGRFIPGFEEAIVGMTPGETRTVTVPPEKGYGRYREDRVLKIDKNDLPEEISPVEGMTLEICAPNGVMIPVLVTEVSGSTVTLDANHPLSEQTLTFKIRLVEIVEGSRTGA